MKTIVLKKIPVKEYDELVVCYSPDFGKATYVAKSVMRPTSKQSSHLDILTLVDFEPVYRNSLALRSFSGVGIITNACSLNNFGSLKSSLPAIAVANYILEVFDKFVFENDPDQKLWDLLYNRLVYLDQLARPSFASKKNFGGVDWRIILSNIQDELSRVLGYDETINLEDIIQSRFNSLAFAREIFSRYEFKNS